MRSSPLSRPIAVMLASALTALLMVATVVAPATGGGRHPHPQGDGFVSARGASLLLGGKSWRFAGTNNYYLMYGQDGLGNQTDVTNVLDDAQEAGLDAIRAWAFFTVMDPDPANRATSIQQGNAPTWFNAYDAQTGEQVFNDGPYGLDQLDFMVAEAGKRGIKLVLPFTNNWSAFGGMDQFIKWADLADGDNGRTWYHDDFYSDPQIRSWFKEWISTLLNRTNSITGVAYKDDPTIAIWELANEPRCRGSVVPMRPGACDPGQTDVITTWADEMSRYVKSIDSRHLVSLGDEGWFCDPDNADTGEGHACTNGVDTVAVTRLPAIDLMSMHLYPDHWGYAESWGTTWIAEHARAAHRLGKPVYLGEYGIQDKSIRNPVYRSWLDTAVRTGVDGTLYWILSSELSDGTIYPDYDGFTVYCPSPVCTTISNHAELMARAAHTWPPVADHDATVTEFGEAVSLTPLANDLSYGSRLRPSTVDLDPAVDGVQGQVVVAGGTFAVQPDASVLFTPTDGFTGFAEATYTVRDSRRRISNMATLRVQVKSQPGASVTLFSFDDGVQGWASTPSWTTESSPEFVTDGANGLKVTVVNEGWVAGVFAEPIDLSTTSLLTFDVAIPADGTSTGSSFAVSFQNGPDYTWCQGPFQYLEAGGQTRLEVDLTADLSCSVTDLTDVRQMNVFMNAAGVRYLDTVVVE